MPLEQIRPPFSPFISSGSGSNNREQAKASSSRKTLADLDCGGLSQLDPLSSTTSSLDDEENDEKSDAASPLFYTTAALPRRRASSAMQHHDGGMNLLKLGGVGGVTRSGSRGRNSSYNLFTASPDADKGDEARDRLESDDDDDDDYDGDAGPSFRSRRVRSLDPAVTVGMHHSTKHASRAPPADTNIHFRSSSSDVPSSSSRTSTSSYSAAAFSLRSVSNRNSVSSASSESSSIRSHGFAAGPSSMSSDGDESSNATAILVGGEGHDTDPSSGSGSSNSSNNNNDNNSRSSSRDASVGGSAATMVDDSDAPGFENGENEGHSRMTSSSTATSVSTSNVGPGINRIRSIGRGGTPRQDARPLSDEVPGPSERQNGRRSSGAVEGEEKSDEDQGSDGSLVEGTKEEEGNETLRLLPSLSTSSSSSQTQQLSPSRSTPSEHLPTSPETLVTPVARLEARPPPPPPTTTTTTRTTPIDATATNDAASPSLPSPSVASKPDMPFQPAMPRKHSGVYALRTRSQQGGAYGSFYGGGGGRAAAREMARTNNFSYDNAPFSVLEARKNGPSSSSRPAMSGYSQPGSPVTQPGFSRASPSFGPYSSMTDARLQGPSRAMLMSPIAQASPDAPQNAFWRQPAAVASLASFSDIADLVGESAISSGTPPSSTAPPSENESAPSRQRGSHRPGLVTLDLAESPSSSSLSSLLETPPGPSSLHVSSPTSADSGARSGVGLGIVNASPARRPERPGLTRSTTALGTQVLRTPTTEEWTRFLARQGLDPAIVARNRTSTSRSSRPSLPLAPSTDLEAADRTLEGGDHANAQMLEQLKQLGMSRATSSRTGSLLGDGADLGSVKEDDEDDDDLEMDQDKDGEEWEEGSDGGMSSYSNSSSYERMRALHEAISRPPSRLSTPPPMNRMELAADEQEHEDDFIQVSAIAPPSERRSISDYVVVSDIGRGAYGLVKKARLKGPNGEVVGDEFCIKYIIKSRILADCWRRHKILGPIPVEIHVLDQLRRLPYTPPAVSPPWSAERMFGVVPHKGEDATLHHPSLCRMLDFFEDHEFYYLVMPCFGSGQDLFDYVESQPHGLSSSQVRSIFGQVADGLRFLHANNIVHRDVKDENVILDGKGHAQLIDFGSAAHVRPGRLFDTFSGTLDYAAAEILRGEKYGGKEQDVWALGVVGYVLLCGDCPFWNGEEAIEGLSEGSRAKLSLMHRCEDVEAPDEAEERREERDGQKDGGGRLVDAADLIARCLELEPTDRPTMEQVCNHRFLVGSVGWSGRLGWREVDP
ncbi:hypothetical protein FA10DRAFT_264590 [Acaromyces ingoldii]|uniref:Protein kinase domain-containing protein n=1 Tax=Acaromyces ingoldii TaxID=215250 RepID=A0A316Z1D5_9BASI|nr:hypothetical protein FA10DRAFT_264590 [Acaromyces ingoldii]PWN93995.1 hypothetical protein FA10DRAFT_264590 [Acaromyces ingoldii]